MNSRLRNRVFMIISGSVLKLLRFDIIQVRGEGGRVDTDHIHLGLAFQGPSCQFCTLATKVCWNDLPFLYITFIQKVIEVLVREVAGRRLERIP